jgi:hypothetical protein
VVKFRVVVPNFVRGCLAYLLQALEVIEVNQGSFVRGIIYRTILWHQSIYSKESWQYLSNRYVCNLFPMQYNTPLCLLCRRGSTSDNFDQLSCNDSLSGAIVKNLKLSNHLTSILGCIIHGIASCCNLTCITFCKSLLF